MNRERYILENSASAIVCREGVRRIVAVPETSIIFLDRPVGQREGLVEVEIDRSTGEQGTRRGTSGSVFMLVQDILGRGKPLAVF